MTATNIIYYARKGRCRKEHRSSGKRKDYPDVVYRTEEAKLRAIVAEIIRFHVIGRPQLVGTTSVEHSDRLSVRLPRPNRPPGCAQVLLIREPGWKRTISDMLTASSRS